MRWKQVWIVLDLHRINAVFLWAGGVSKLSFTTSPWPRPTFLNPYIENEIRAKCIQPIACKNTSHTRNNSSSSGGDSRKIPTPCAVLPRYIPLIYVYNVATGGVNVSRLCCDAESGRKWTNRTELQIDMCILRGSALVSTYFDALVFGQVIFWPMKFYLSALLGNW